MASKKRGLGRGLDALIGTVNQMPAAGTTDDRGSLRAIPLEKIRPGRYQPRREFAADALEELANSIKAQGVMQPIVVRPIGADGFEIVAGERRWRAAQLAGLEDIPASVREVPDQAAMAMALIENIQREDLNVIEQATALQRLQQEFNLTHEQIAGAVGKSRTTITNVLRLLQLEPLVRRLLEQGSIEMGHARALLGLSASEQVELAQQVERRGLSVRETEALVRRLQAPGRTVEQRARKDPDIAQLERRLAERTGSKVVITHRKSGRGKLSFQYNSMDELQGLLERLGPLD